jgi:hypothetical protein
MDTDVLDLAWPLLTTLLLKTQPDTGATLHLGTMELYQLLVKMWKSKLDGI